jgi:acetyl-CoA C-acetyltransferase
MAEAFVLGQVRTPRGKGSARGALAAIAPGELVRQLIAALVARGLAPDAIDDVVLGCASQLDAQGGNLARAAALAAGLGDRAGGTMINRFCASGLEAVAIAAARVRAGDCELVLAGGVESVSQVPLFADRGPWWRDGVGRLHMGIAADLAATVDGTARATLDAYAARTRARARAADAAGRLHAWTVPVRAADGAIALARDELLDYAPTADQLAALPSAFAELGASGQDALALAHAPGLATLRHDHTRASSPPLADAAALLVIGTAEAAARHGLTPRARVVAAASVAADPVAMLTAGQHAIERVLRPRRPGRPRPRGDRVRRGLRRAVRAARARSRPRPGAPQPRRRHPGAGPRLRRDRRDPGWQRGGEPGGGRRPRARSRGGERRRRRRQRGLVRRPVMAGARSGWSDLRDDDRGDLHDDDRARRIVDGLC